MIPAEKQGVMNTFAGEMLVAIGICLFIYILAGVFFPFLFILPLPLLVFSLKRGLPAGLCSIAAVTGAIVYSARGANALPLVVVLCAGLAGVLIIWMDNKKVSISRIAMIIIVIPLLMVPAVLVGLDRLLPSSVSGDVAQSYSNLEKNVHSMMDNRGIAVGNRPEIEQLLKNSKWFLLNLYPAFFAALAVIALLISLAAADRFSPALTGLQMKWPKIRNLRLPESAILLFVVSGAGTLLMKGTALFILSNLLAFTIFMFLIQGLALISFMNYTFGIKPFAQTVIYLAFLLIPFSPFLLSAFGMLDVWIPMRRKIEDLHHKLSEDLE
jgi:uncharacterized protein YybS (DUF2232 family)